MTETLINPNNKLFIGMDLHKNTSTLCVKNKEGDEIVFGKINTDKNEVRKFIENVKEKSNDLSLVMELVSQ